MRVALVKQVLDVFGPWSSVRWNTTDPRSLFNLWPGKVSLWEMTCLLQADWYVIPEVIKSDYHRDLLVKNKNFRDLVWRHAMNIIPIQEIPFEQYDVVISLDPILYQAPSGVALKAYFINENWDRLYWRSLKRPLGNYDLFLAHMLDSHKDINTLPQAISFPYIRAPEVLRSLFPAEKEKAAWVDWRTLCSLGMVECWGPQAEKAALRMQEILSVPIRFYGEFNRQAYGVHDPPSWGNGYQYLEKLARCQFYISLGWKGGPGQALVDAASLGCICLGERDKPYHRLICHPSCLCSGLFEMPKRFKAIVMRTDLQQEILSWQEQALREHFMEKPLAFLRKAIEYKKRGCLRRFDSLNSDS